jgi:hypothetical protein
MLYAMGCDGGEVIIIIIIMVGLVIVSCCCCCRWSKYGRLGWSGWAAVGRCMEAAVAVVVRPSGISTPNGQASAYIGVLVRAMEEVMEAREDNRHQQQQAQVRLSRLDSTLSAPPPSTHVTWLALHVSITYALGLDWS